MKEFPAGSLSLFAIAFDRRQKVVLIQFDGRFGADDLTGLDDIARVLIEAEDPMDVIFDFSRSDGVDLTREAMANRGRQPQMQPGQRRAIVAPRPEMFELARLFAQSQSAVGSAAPIVTQTLDEALRAFGLTRLNTQKVEIDWLREELRASRDSLRGA